MIRHLSTTECLKRTNLIILWRQFVQALLYNVVTVEVLDENNHVKAKRDDNGMNLSIVSMVRLLFIC
jgi:hypothetical protein